MPIKILEYRNGIYQGQVKGNKRHGEGILITDQNMIMVGEWKNDLMTGKGFVFLNPQQYGYGEFNRGQIQGFFLFRAKSKTLFSQFNMSHPINKMVLINHENQRVQTIIHKTPIFEVISEKSMSNRDSSQQQQIFNVIGKRFPCYSLLDYLQRQVCEKDRYSRRIDRKQSSISNISNNKQQQQYFTIKSLNNGNILFSFNDPTNPVSIGFCLNKNEQLVSCGMYVNDKLNGLGCKYQNAVRYQGLFQAGFINGIGLKNSQGKYSFGQFQNGNLIQALFIDDRTNASQEKLKQFKKSQHIRSLWYQNSYIRRNIMKFKGINQLIFQINQQHQYMYPINNNLSNSITKKQKTFKLPNQVNTILNTSLNAQLNKSVHNTSIQNNNNSGSKNLALNMMMKRQGDKLQTKSSKQLFTRQNLDQSRNFNINNNNSFEKQINMRKTANPNMNMNIINTKTSLEQTNNKWNNNNVGQFYYKNPQIDDDLLIQQNRNSKGLKNLRKFKY